MVCGDLCGNPGNPEERHHLFQRSDVVGQELVQTFVCQFLREVVELTFNGLRWSGLSR